MWGFGATLGADAANAAVGEVKEVCLGGARPLGLSNNGSCFTRSGGDIDTHDADYGHLTNDTTCTIT